MKADVEKIFDEYLKKTLGQKPEVLSFLINHERKNVCLNNLCAEIIKCENKVIFFNASKYRTVIEEVAKLFASRALESHRQSHMTGAERLRMQTEADRIKRAEEHIKDLEKEALTGREREKLYDERKKREEIREARAKDKISKGLR